MEINYGAKKIPLGIDDKNIVFALHPRPTSGMRNLSIEIDKALTNPIGALPLVEIARSSKRALILADDNTRLTPTKEIIPVILDHLSRGGIKDDSIALLVASGSHRHMTQEEKELKFGHDVMKRLKTIDHECSNPNELIYLGKLRSGTPVMVNRRIPEYDLRIGVGTIMPHCPAGWSGGAKILLPGAAGIGTIGRMHLLGADTLSLGVVRTRCRTEMEGLAKKAGLEFIVNTVLNDTGETVGIVAGHFIKAHRAGVRIARRANGAVFKELADIVISSTYPVDYDLFQADKGLFSGVITVKPEGTLLMVSPCFEGISPAHPSLIDIGTLSDNEIIGGISDGTIKDVLSGAEALYLNSVKRRCKKVILVTDGISRTDCRKLGFEHLLPEQMVSYLTEAIAVSPNLKVGILTNSAEVLPIFRPGNK